VTWTTLTKPATATPAVRSLSAALAERAMPVAATSWLRPDPIATPAATPAPAAAPAPALTAV
jgi:hypothetical protein